MLLAAVMGGSANSVDPAPLQFEHGGNGSFQCLAHSESYHPPMLQEPEREGS